MTLQAAADSVRIVDQQQTNHPFPCIPLVSYLLGILMSDSFVPISPRAGVL